MLLDVEITPLEFLEVLVESASVFVTAEILAKHNKTELSDVLPVFELPTIPSVETTTDETDNGENKSEKMEGEGFEIIFVCKPIKTYLRKFSTNHTKSDRLSSKRLSNVVSFIEIFFNCNN